jgi:hypothetical protein
MLFLLSLIAFVAQTAGMRADRYDFIAFDNVSLYMTNFYLMKDRQFDWLSLKLPTCLSCLIITQTSIINQCLCCFRLG